MAVWRDVGALGAWGGVFRARLVDETDLCRAAARVHHRDTRCGDRSWVTLAALYAAMIALPFAVLTLLTGGGFAQKTIGYQGSWQWQAFRRLAQPFVERYAHHHRRGARARSFSSYAPGGRPSRSVGSC